MNQTTGSNQTNIHWASVSNQIEHVGYKTNSLGCDLSERLPDVRKRKSTGVF